MADRFVQQATNTLNPIYDTQIKSLNAQIPAIQQLYQSLSGALTTQNQQQIDTGVQNIAEDASARGVLRSTLPVDARANLTSTLGAALTTALGQNNLQQLQQVGDIQSKIGTLGVNKANDISSLANSLRTSDLELQKFNWQKQVDTEQLAIARANAASKATGLSPAELKVQVGTHVAQQLASNVGKDGHVSNEVWASALNDAAAIGFTAREFWQKFGQFVNGKYGSSYAGYTAR